MEAAPKKKIVAKVTANIYEPPSPNTVNVVRAKISSSSVTRSASVVNGSTHSRNNSVTRTPIRAGTGQFDAFTTRASAPASTVGKSALSPNSLLLLSPESSPSPTSPGNRQQPRILAPQARKATLTINPLNNRFKAHQSAAPTPISPPTSPQFNYLSEPGTTAHGVNSIPKRVRVTSSIRLPLPQIVASKPDAEQTTPTPIVGHRRTPSVSSTAGTTNKPRVITNGAKITPQQILSAPPRAQGPGLLSQSPPSSVISSRSSISMNSSSLIGLSYNPTASGGEEDEEQEQEQDESFDADRVDTPQPEMDEDAIFAEEARSNRKILDLEISNRSLLAVNTMLEATKLRQTREIKDLRRKLRETKHLPTKTFYTTKETMSPTTSDLSLPNNNSNSSHSSDEEEEAEPDPVYDRITRLVEGLLSQAQRALERSIDDCMPVSTNTVKVLSAAEVEQYARRAQGLPDEEEASKEVKVDEHDALLDGSTEDGRSNHEDEGELADDDRSKRKTSMLVGRRRASLMTGRPPD